MSHHYQVFANYILEQGKPSLVELSLHSTSEYFPFLVGSYTSLLSHSRFFHTVPEAEHYINYLFSRYQNCGLARPALDALQLLLFNGL
jgi:demethoxyubiquinone hydroxylase (CLK1/Coq7/Cat5 family)